MDEVKECHKMNEQVRRWFENIPSINDFNARRAWTYMGEVLRTKMNHYQRKCQEPEYQH